MTADFQRIAVVRHCGIGDVVQLTPLLQQLRADVPAGKIEIFINDNVAALLDDCPFVDRVHSLPEKCFLPGKRNFMLWQLWRRVRQAGKFDLLLNLTVAWLNTLLCMGTRARRRAGLISPYRKPVQPWHYHLMAVRDIQVNQRHTSQLYLDLWKEASGAEDRGFGYNITHLAGNEPKLPGYICLAPGAGNAATPGEIKRWPRRKWLALAGELAERGYHPVFVGSANDLDGLPVPSGATSMLGRQTLLEVTRFMARAEGLVGHDSGLYQIALGLNIPALGLFGPTSPLTTGPFRNPHGRALAMDLPCVPCWEMSCRVPTDGRPEANRPFCMNELPVASVLSAAYFARDKKNIAV